MIFVSDDSHLKGFIIISGAKTPAELPPIVSFSALKYNIHVADLYVLIAIKQVFETTDQNGND